MNLIYMWAGIGGTLAVGYYILGRAIKVQAEDFEARRKEAQELAKP